MTDEHTTVLRIIAILLGAVVLILGYAVLMATP